jgi:hypothetical protein
MPYVSKMAVCAAARSAVSAPRASARLRAGAA